MSRASQSAIMSRAHQHQSTRTDNALLLPGTTSGLVPAERDVICGRGRIAKDNPGNAEFRKYLNTVVDRYQSADSKMMKSCLVSQIVKSVRLGGGRFLVKKIIKNSGEQSWDELGEQNAREKVSQSMRDLLHSKYRSSQRAKSIHRKAINGKLHDAVEVVLNNKSVARRMHDAITLATRGATDQCMSDLLDDTCATILATIKKRREKGERSIIQAQQQQILLDDEASSSNNGADNFLVIPALLFSEDDSIGGRRTAPPLQCYEEEPPSDEEPAPTAASACWWSHPPLEESFRPAVSTIATSHQSSSLSDGDAFVSATWQSFGGC